MGGNQLPFDVAPLRAMRYALGADGKPANVAGIKKALVERIPEPLAATVMVQEQPGLAHNRAGHGEEAERVLIDLIERRGPSSETYGILGRVYKGRWQAAEQSGNRSLRHVCRARRSRPT